MTKQLIEGLARLKNGKSQSGRNWNRKIETAMLVVVRLIANLGNENLTVKGIVQGKQE